MTDAIHPVAFLGATERAVLRAAQEVFLPPTSVPGVPDLSLAVDRFFAGAKTVLRLLIRAGLWAVEYSPLPSRFTRFSRLTLPERQRWVERLESSRGPLRQLFLLLKVLLYTNAYDEKVLGRTLLSPDGGGR